MLVTQEVQNSYRKGEILESCPPNKNFVSQIFLIEKKGGGQCPAISLKPLNQYVLVEHLRLTPSTRPATTRGLDDKNGSKNAYIQIPILLSHWYHFLLLSRGEALQQIKFLGFQINSDSMSISLPSQNGRKIQQEAVRLLIEVTNTLSIRTYHDHKENQWQFLELLHRPQYITAPNCTLRGRIKAKKCAV